MPDEKKLDPFKPQQPSIPGVLPEAEKKKPAAKSSPPADAMAEQPAAPRPPILWIALAAGTVFLIAVGLLVWSRSTSPRAGEPVTATTTPPDADSGTQRPAGHMAVAPGPVGTTDEFAKPWSSKRFLYRNPLTAEVLPAMVVRLPGGDFWGFSLHEPYGNCELEFVTNLGKLQTEYRYRANHPMVGDPCNHTVYDLLRYGGGSSDDGLVRGEIVQGNGIRPPFAIEIRVDGNQVIAARME
jgi:hypothetical protein